MELPEYIIKKLSFDKKNQFGISLKVIGFNSKKFDINIFINYITDEKIHIRYKYSIKLQFLDLKSFLAEGDLDKYSIKFADKLDLQPEFKKQKGVFLTNF